MTSVPPKQRARHTAAISIAFTLALTLVPLRHVSQAQTAAPVNAAQPEAQAAQTPARPLFRLETLPVGDDAELLTIFGTLRGLSSLPRRDDATPAPEEDADVPLVSILRDTLGDSDPENDRLRYVWMFTYTRPTALQRAASAVPFLYKRVGNKKHASKDAVPPALLDLASPERDTWQRIMWLALRNLIFNPYGALAKTATGTLNYNAFYYRQAHVIRALAILSLYEAESGAESVFNASEMSEIQGRLMLTDKFFGGIVDDDYVTRAYQNQVTLWRDTRGHNWELLRQRAEMEGLYFDPLLLPDGSATHALVWVAREDLEKNRGRKFEGRFLSISNPWNDRRLVRWNGYVDVRYYDAENQLVEAGTPGARRIELIPLAIYGLDHPKIPSLLVDFRDGGNPKRREVSHRLIEDIARNVLSLSRYGDIHYFLGRTVFDFVTSRRGMDINQPTRMRAYTQLKLLLSLDDTLDPEFREEVSRRLERVSVNPLENDLDAEAQLAREQHAALLAYAARPDGLRARLDHDRREELVPLAHGRTSRVLFRLANLLSLGAYTHREKTASLTQRELLDGERRLAYHRRFLRRVAKSSPLVEVAWNIEDVRRSLRFVAEHGSRADKETATAAARIFTNTQDDEARRLCLSSLYRIDNETAKNELLRIYRIADLDPSLRLLTAEYLRKAIREEQRIAPTDARAIISVLGQ